MCKQVLYCDLCLTTYGFRKADNPHVCGESFCSICKKHMPANHLCYIRPDKRANADKKRNLFLFFDLETRQETDFPDDQTVKYHSPNLCVVQQVCTACKDDDNILQNCASCGVRQHIFKNNPIREFLAYVFLPRKSFTYITCVAHNGQAFDSQFILKFMVESLKLTPSIILRGSKILCLECKGVRFVDSLNYTMCALANLPAMFGLPPSNKKGYFPHLFNTRANQAYVGALPAARYYSPDTMTQAKREEFFKWYNEQPQDLVFDFQKELVEYCVSDVTILRLACIKFRTDFLRDCDVCPFTEAVTIASACMLTFRRKYLIPQSIGIIPRGGYRMNDNQSVIALKWLNWVSFNKNIQIQHAGNARERVVLGGFKVDGFDPLENHVYEFYGCFFHGHMCITARRDRVIRNSVLDTLERRFQKTQARAARLRVLGYTVTEKWECEFRREMKRYPWIEPIVSSDMVLPLNPRDAFYGGRTGNTKLYHKAEENEKIKYLDVCSLYPWVCKYGRFPLSHPTVIVLDADINRLVGPFNDLSQVEGLIKCSVLPPQNLYHPVLPQKANGKLMFSLCRLCTEQMTQGNCNHLEKDRVLTGTWVVDEVRKAVELGYVIKKIHEIWQYEITQYDKITGQGGLFVPYINAFLKIKQEASGFPSECVTDVQKNLYIAEYLAKEGVALDIGSIIKNPGKRSLGKACLNSHWGKFGQRESISRTTIIQTENELFTFLTDPSIIVNHILLVDQETIYVNWEEIEAVTTPLANVNCVIAAYVTCQARLRLFSYLHKLDRQVLYYDTDSVIYRISNNPGPGEHDLPTGNFLGCLTDELTEYGPGSYIGEFVSSGPKSYAYTVLSGEGRLIKTICKIKGITLNYRNTQILNFDSIKQMILENNQDPVVVTGANIRRTASHDVITKEETKRFRINFMKRRREQTFDSLPYGFKKPRN